MCNFVGGNVVPPIVIQKLKIGNAKNVQIGQLINECMNL